MKIKSLLGIMLLISVMMNAAYAGSKAKDLASAFKTSHESVKPVSSLFSQVTTFDELQMQLKQAKKSHQPVMIEFYASWCPSCRSLDTYVFSLEQVQALMRPFRNIRVDLTEKNDDLMQIVMYYQINGTPTFVFYDKKGSEFDTDRFKNLDELTQVLEKLGGESG